MNSNTLFYIITILNIIYFSKKNRDFKTLSHFFLNKKTSTVELPIDLSQSLLIGDHASDLIAGQNAGISHNILLTNGSDTEALKAPFADKYVDLSTFVASMRNIFKNR